MSPDNEEVRGYIEQYFDIVYDRVLSSNSWNFARKKIFFTRNVPVAEENGFFGEYDFPTDFISLGSTAYVVGNNDSGTAVATPYYSEWRQQGSKILIYLWGGIGLDGEREPVSNEYDVRVFFEYISRPPLETISAPFSIALGYALADFVAPAYNKEAVPYIRNAYQNALKEAIQHDDNRIPQSQTPLRRPSRLLPEYRGLGGGRLYWYNPADAFNNY